jgi:hypothetical protein
MTICTAILADYVEIERGLTESLIVNVYMMDLHL